MLPEGAPNDGPAPPAGAVSAVVCTRNRGPRVAATVESVLANTGCDFELIVVDQSTDDRVAEAMARFLPDERVRYLRSDTVGVSRARNLGLAAARTAVVAFTDDDVTVPRDWLATTGRLFDEHERVVVAFYNVRAAPHDAAKGFIPAYLRPGTHVVTGVLAKCAAKGIGAGLSVRRQPVLDLGGFDGLLGPGARFPSCEDGDMALRALLAGWEVLETDAVTVTHDGFRTWEEGKALTKRDWYGIGAAYAKPIRAGKLATVVVVAYEGIWRAVLLPFAPLLRMKRPQGLRRGWYFWRGFARALTMPVDRRSLLFAEQAAR
jgi:glycosyltransferase involved in cell wall biosynthesis